MSTGQMLAKMIAFNQKLVNESQKLIDMYVARGYSENHPEFAKAIQINKDARSAMANAKWTASL